MAAAIAILAAVAACIAIWISRPDRKWLAIVATALTLSTGLWSAAHTYEQGRRQREVELHALDMLVRATGGFNETLWQAAYQSGAGWKPRTESEFFSEKMAEVICRLRPTGAAPTVPPISWETFLARETKRLFTELDDFLASYGTTVDSRFIQPVSSLRRNGTLSLVVSLEAYDLEEMGMQPRPRLCAGFEGMLVAGLQDLQTIRILLQGYAHVVDIADATPWIRQGDLSK